MKKLILVLFLSGLFLSSAWAENTTAFDVDYDNYGALSYRDCGQCIGYYSEVGHSASIVLSEKENRAYWVVNLFLKEDGQPGAEFYFVDRNPDLNRKFQGTYYPLEDISGAFEFKELELRPGGHIVAKLHPVKIKSLGYEKLATFSGSFDLKLQN